MRYILAALLLAGAAWAATNYWIRIWGNEEGLYVDYTWIEDVNGDGEATIESDGFEAIRHDTFEIDSLDDIRPTPEEMEGK